MLISLLAPAFAFASAQEPLTANRVVSVIAQAQDPPVVVVAPDQAFWTELASTLRGRHGVAATLPEDARDAELRALVERMRLTPPRFEDVDELEVITEALAALSGMPLVLDPLASDAMINEGVVINLNWSHPTAFRTVLDALTDMAGDEVEWIVEHGTIVITTRERARTERHVFLHPIADLAPLTDSDDLATLIQENILPGSWAEEGVAIEPTGTFMVVVHTREAHLAVEQLLSDLRTFQASLAHAPKFAPGPAEVSHEERLAWLASVRITPDFHGGGAGTHITQVAAFLQELSGMNFVVSSAVLDELDEEELRIAFSLPEADLRTVLDLIPQVCPHLRWTLDGEIVRFLTVEEYTGGQVFALYDVRSIIQSAPQGFSFRVDPDDELEAMVLNSSLLEDLIRNTISPDSWDEDPANSIRIMENGVMTVNQTPSVHALMRSFLSDLQAIADTMAEVGRRHSR